MQFKSIKKITIVSAFVAFLLFFSCTSFVEAQILPINQILPPVKEVIPIKVLPPITPPITSPVTKTIDNIVKQDTKDNSKKDQRIPSPVEITIKSNPQPKPIEQDVNKSVYEKISNSKADKKESNGKDVKSTSTDAVLQTSNINKTIQPSRTQNNRDWFLDLMNRFIGGTAYSPYAYSKTLTLLLDLFALVSIITGTFLTTSWVYEVRLFLEKTIVSAKKKVLVFRK